MTTLISTASQEQQAKHTPSCLSLYEPLLQLDYLHLLLRQYEQRLLLLHH